ncbi:hypothetical protein PGT21_021626 [Puccinia graminis f. sp. tritici]|uniref:Phorbol-ester/DAG-type domain-containing protein n=1 Tax=Puccinia graminis f. sp. tritici TaxID=56615 RepID=A0A5B0RV43_PUCGR|nr:hypothetical protein PGT21_021626 [Puccinia graminis f. sp. tritici]KAA1129149.1 hypothetical protein PGTUg99_031604 [Puccinia graminis f. sp. tritici]
MLSIYILVAAMLSQVLAETAIIHPSDQIASVEKNAQMKSGHQLTKRMESIRAKLSGKCGKCHEELDSNSDKYKCSECDVYYHTRCGSGQDCPTCKKQRQLQEREVKKAQYEQYQNEIQYGRESSSRRYSDEDRHGSQERDDHYSQNRYY